jgi:hypothetical protein
MHSWGLINMFVTMFSFIELRLRPGHRLLVVAYLHIVDYLEGHQMEASRPHALCSLKEKGRKKSFLAPHQILLQFRSWACTFLPAVPFECSRSFIINYKLTCK